MATPPSISPLHQLAITSSRTLTVAVTVAGTVAVTVAGTVADPSYSRSYSYGAAVVETGI